MDTFLSSLPTTNQGSSNDLDTWRNFFEELGSSAWIWNLSTDAVDFTTTWLNFLGYSSQEISTGEHWFSLLHPDDKDPVTAQTNSCIANEAKNLDIEFRLRKKNGTFIWVNSRAKIISLDDNTKVFLGLYTDITRQQETKSLIAENESRWNSALEGSGVGVWEWDIKSGELYWSSEFYRIVKLDENTTHPRFETWYSLIIPEHREKNERKLNDYLTGKTQHYRDEHQITCGDGSRIWILTRATVSARSDSGEPTRMIGTLDDISARKTQEQETQSAHERIRRVTSTIPGFVFEYHMRPDGAHYFPYASEGIKDIYNLQPSEARKDASAIDKVIHPDDLERVQQAVKTSADTGHPLRVQFRILRSDGQIRIVGGSANRRESPEPDGTLVWFGYLKDITDEVRTAERGEQIAQLVPGALFQYTTWPDGRRCFPYSTAGMGKYFGVPDEMLADNGDIPMQAVHPEDLQKTFDVVRHSGEHRRGWDLEYRVVLNNEIRWHRSTTNIVEGETIDGSITWYGYLSDITEAKTRELQIAEQHQLLAEVTKTIPGVITQYVIAPDNSVTIPFLSDGVREIFGIDKQTAMNDPLSLWTYIHPDDKPNLIKAVEASQDLDLEYRVLLPKIGEQWRRSLAACVIGNDGTRTYYSYVMDATEGKQYELTLKRQAEVIALANDDLEQFNYVAAHDLKEPLRAIKHLSEWIEEDLPPDLDASVTENLARMRARVQRLQILVDDLAAYSRAGRQGYDTNPVNLRSLVARIVDDIEHLNFHPDIEGVEDIEINTVEIALETVFKNLINNAVQHQDESSSGRIVVTTETDEYFVTCQVEDDGPGIAPEHHERVFKMYQRLNPADNTARSGSGLTIIRRIIGTAHGTIHLESPISSNGRGTRFTFRWPINWPREPEE